MTNKIIFALTLVIKTEWLQLVHFGHDTFFYFQENIWSEVSKLSLEVEHVGFCPGDIRGNIFVLPTSENGFATKVT